MFLKGCGVVDRSKQMANPMKEQINEFQWDLICQLDIQFESFTGICTNISSDTIVWKNYINNKNGISVELPDPFQTQLDSFDKLILVKTLKY